MASCATYQGHVSGARDHLKRGEPEKAMAILKPLAEKEGGDQLIYILDYATALQAAELFKESNQWFEKAYRLAEQKDYTSLSRQAGSLLFAQELVQYSGEDFEKLFIHIMMALNYLKMNDLEGANVETRRLIERLNYYRIEEKKPYEQNPFALYLNGHIWEANKNFDSAYIDFEKSYKVNPALQAVREDLVRTAYKARRIEKLNEWSKKFNIPKKKEWDSRQHGELVIFYLQGFGPRKAPRPDSPRFPRLVPTFNRTVVAQTKLVREGFIFDKKNTEMAYDVQSVAIKTLDDQMEALIAKRVGGIVAKEVVAHQVGKKNEALGLAAWVAMNVSDRADLRQWSTLPQTIQVARYYLPVGQYELSIEGLDINYQTTGESFIDKDIRVESGKKSFVIWRSWQ